ncbi:MAG: YqgE/AlgH family protein [Flavobacteriales bacterium]|nr:YqgE/AlgH family protein [Flavobacteriales bacterium]
MPLNSKHSFDEFFKNLQHTRVQPSTGDVLISEPFLADPNFARSVILLIRHDDEGSVGFVLNELARFTIGEVLPDFPMPSLPVYLGGPVGKQHLFVIHTLGHLLPDAIEISDGLFWGGDFETITAMAKSNELDPNAVKFFAGYSGWSEGQLKKEIFENSWITSRLETPLVMSHQVQQLWKKTLIKMGDAYKIISNFPKDPALN